MNVEHIAFLVDDPGAVSDWYCRNLGMRVVREGGPPNFMTFLVDEDEKTMFEIYSSPEVETPDYFSLDPMALHFAFVADNMEETLERLYSAGATSAGETIMNDFGDRLEWLRDPWGVPVQLVSRKEPIL